MSVKIPIPIDIAKWIQGRLENAQLGITIQPEDFEDIYRMGYCAGGLVAMKELEKAIAK